MHDGNHCLKFHYARLLRTARLLGKLEYVCLYLQQKYVAILLFNIMSSSDRITSIAHLNCLMSYLLGFKKSFDVEKLEMASFCTNFS